MLTDAYMASRRNLKGKFDDCSKSVYNHALPIGRSFERHKIAYTENSNRAEDYSTGFIIDYAHAQTNEQSF